MRGGGEGGEVFNYLKGSRSSQTYILDKITDRGLKMLTTKGGQPQVVELIVLLLPFHLTTLMDLLHPGDTKAPLRPLLQPEDAVYTHRSTRVFALSMHIKLK